LSNDGAAGLVLGTLGFAAGAGLPTPPLPPLQDDLDGVGLVGAVVLGLLPPLHEEPPPEGFGVGLGVEGRGAGVLGLKDEPPEGLLPPDHDDPLLPLGPA